MVFVFGYRFIKTVLVLVLVFTSLLYSSCGSPQTILKEKTKDSGKIVINKGLFRGISYLKIQKSKNGKTQYTIWLEFGEVDPFLASKNIPGKAKEYETWHLITDTTNSLKSFDKYLNPNIYLYNGKSVVPISKEELEIFHSLNERLLEKQSLHNFKNEQISKMIGWVKVN
jgi:hypothetical protein